MDPGVVPQQQTDSDLLAVLKQQATQGKLVDYTGLSYLGRALAETLRDLPPIWTLPRTWPVDATCVAAKLDVVAVNGVLLDPRDDWNRRCYVTSFGLGKRHFPAVTAALFAAYQLLLYCSS
jgi:hypothetical protein